jgi:murein DD-endopeptidase MepM/ murein hydrolase activator NlpD
LRRNFLFSLCFLLGVSLAAAGADDISLSSPLGTKIEFICSSFEPGQIVLARLKYASGTKKVLIRFLDQRYELEPSHEGGSPFALIGLDLGLKPGSHVFDITILREDGRVERLEKGFSFAAKEFPVKKLWVKASYVTPPPDVQSRIQWETELLESIYSINTAAWLGDGRFTLPNSGEMASNFGERRVYNNVPRSTHAGVDVKAAYGSPVQAANSGKVVLAKDLYFSGKTVIIDHGLGVFTFYCHFSRIKVKRGDSVKRGDIVGLVGSTGRSTGPHLHWGVKIHASRVDPLALLGLPL